MSRIEVTHRYERSFDVDVRGHSLICDDPATLGGEDQGPTSTELIVAGMAACAAGAATRRLLELGLPHEPMQVSAEFSWEDGGQRIAEVRLLIKLPPEIEEPAREEVLAEVLHSPAGRLLTSPPEISYELAKLGQKAVVAVGVASRAQEDWPPEPPPDVDSEDV